MNAGDEDGGIEGLFAGNDSLNAVNKKKKKKILYLVIITISKETLRYGLFFYSLLYFLQIDSFEPYFV